AVKLDLSDMAFAEEAGWGNRAVTGGLSGGMNGFTGELRASASRYDARLPVADSLPLFAQSRSDRLRITGDLSHPWGDGVLRFGASVDVTTSDYVARGLDTLGALVESRLNLDGTSRGVYLEGARPLAPSLTFRGGLRLDHFSGGEGARLAPRAALSWLLAENAVLTLAAGRYHQFSSLSSVEVEKTLSAAGGGAGNQGTTHQLAVGVSNHLVIAMDQILAPGLRVGIEGFVKDFTGITGVEGEHLSSSGVDLRVAREGARASGWLGYTLSWFWASEEGFLGGDSRFAGRHLLSAGLSTRLSERTGLRVRVGYGNGLPYTSIPISRDAATEPGVDTGADPGGEVFTLDTDHVMNEAPGLAIGPDQGFLRVEGEIHGSWTATLGGRIHEFRPYVRVLNALNRRDALFYHFDPWRSPTPRPLAELPILPLVGLEWVF
ncbi:MAG: TonB-dependent receptor domain-containing protein, partial [Longimicrobiales bacterium]